MGWIFSFIVILMTYLHRTELSPEVIATYVVAAAIFGLAGSVAFSLGGIDIVKEKNDENS